MSEPGHRQPTAPWPPLFSPSFVERTRDLLDRRPVLVVVGPLGGSRDRLAADVAAAPYGPALTRHVARHGEKDLPFFAAQQLIDGLQTSPDDDPRGVEAAARAALAPLASPPTFVLVDADLCDPASIRLLTQLAVTGDLRLVATLAPETVPEQTQLLSAAEVVEVPPLDGPALSALLTIRFGAVPEPAVVESLLERSTGSYGVVREISNAAYAAGMITATDGVLVLAPDRDDPGAEHLTRLRTPPTGDRPDVDDLVHLTSILGELDLDEAGRHLGQEAVSLAVDHGTLQAQRGGLTFVSRAEGTLTWRTLPHARQVELFDRFSTLLTTSYERPGVALRTAEWWRSAGRRVPAALAARAAREANLAGQHRRALIFTDPDHNEEGVHVEPIERAFALVELGDLDQLGAMFAALDPQELSEDELLPYLRWTSRQPAGPEQTRRVEAAIASDDPQEALRRAAVHTLAHLLERAFREAGDELITQVRALTFSAQLSPRNRAAAFTALSLVQRHSGHPDQAVTSGEFAVQILLEDPATLSAFHLDVARECHILALITAVDLDGAERAITDYASGVPGVAGSGRMAPALRGLVGLLRGDVEQALVNARLCLAGLHRADPHQIRGWVEAMLAQLLVQCDRPDEARDALEVSRAHPSDRLQHDLERRITEACVHDALAEPEEALAILVGVAETARARHLRLAEIDAAVLSVQIGGPPHLPTLLSAVGDLVDPSGTPQIWQEFARAAAAYDIEALVDLAGRLETRGAQLFAAEVAQYVLDMARRATDLDPATRDRLRGLADPVSHRHVTRS